MENVNLEKENLIRNMKALKEKRTEVIKLISQNSGFDNDKTDFSNCVTVKYLGKMEFTVEGKEELVEKDVFMTIEEIDGQFQFRYYDVDYKLLGIQKAIENDIILSMDLSTKPISEQRKIKEQLEEKDKEEAKTLEELEEEQKLQEEQNPQQLPGLEEEPRLTKKQVNKMNGPKIELNQIVDEETLRNVINLEGEYIQFVDSDTLKKLMPELNIQTNQKTIPIEIFPDGTANVIEEDKLKFSNIEGTNSQEEHMTLTNEGKIKNEQNIETFNIVSKSGKHTLAVGYDENDGLPLNVKYGRRSRENPRDIAYAELETVHEGPLQQDDVTKQYQEEATGIEKGQDSIEATVERYAIAMNIRKVDEYGYPTAEYDLDLARQELESSWADNPDASLEELIDKDQKQLGPNGNTRM